MLVVSNVMMDARVRVLSNTTATTLKNLIFLYLFLLFNNAVSSQTEGRFK